MAHITTVDVTNGVPTAGTGTVYTLDQVIALLAATATTPWTFGAGATGAGTPRIALASDSPGITTLGQTTKINSLPVTIASDQGANAVTVADGSDATQGVTTGAAVITDAAGTVQQYLRGLIKQWIAGTLVVGAGENHIGAIGGKTIVQAASSTITRPADTTAYTSGDLVANSVTAGSVNALQFSTAARVSGGSGAILGATIQKSTNSTTNAAFRLHLFNTVPTFTSAGDNSAISTVVVASGKGYLGYVDITAMVGLSDVAWGTGAPDNNRGSIPFAATAQIIYGIVEARGAYTPGNAEVFTVSIAALQD